MFDKIYTHLWPPSKKKSNLRFTLMENLQDLVFKREDDQMILKDIQTHEELIKQIENNQDHFLL